MLSSYFSFADIDYKGEQGNNVMRWAPVINIQSALNYDVAKSFGLFTGIALRNVDLSKSFLRGCVF